MKFLIVVFMLFVCCYCLEEATELLEEDRAKKKKVSTKFWSTLIFLIFSKIAITKILSTIFFWFLFQNLTTFLGWLVKLWMSRKQPGILMTPDIHTPHHHDYNTVGYSYGPPKDHNNEHVEWKVPHAEPVKDISVYGLPQNWPYNRRSGNEVE